MGVERTIRLRRKRHEMRGGCLDTKPWSDTVDECFEDAVKGLYFLCVDIRTVWLVLPVDINGTSMGGGGGGGKLSQCYYVTNCIITFYDLFIICSSNVVLY